MYQHPYTESGWVELTQSTPAFFPHLQFTSPGVCLLWGEWRGELIAESRNLFMGSDLENPGPAGPT